MQKKIYKIIAAIIFLTISLWSISSLINNFKNVDRDGDGVSDHDESVRGTDPTKKDTDNDGLDDKTEYDYWMNRSINEGDKRLAPNGDIDGDGLINILDQDSDGDGISDGQEIKDGTDPAKWDTDGDGLSDGDELAHGTNPNNPDSDNDGIPDGSDSTPNGPQNPGDLTYGQSQSTTDPTRNGHDSTPTCFAVFNPYLGGMKRYDIFDSIRENYQAYIADTSYSQIELSNTRYENVFVGTITLEIEGGKIKIPSVAPNANIISYSWVDPSEDMAVRFYKDGADNYYVEPSQTTWGKATLIFTTSADSSYFNFNVPDSLTLDDYQNINSNLKHTPPSSVISKANIVIDHLGLTGEKNLKRIINRLVEYFSSFTPGDIPSAEEQPDAYLAMALSKHGCCYVRSFACFITANSIGIPTRLVKNECHAFVEMYIPNNGWMRVHLGGCGSNFQNPDNYDPFENYTNPNIPPGGGGGGEEPGNLTTTTITDVSSIAYKEGTFTVKGYVRDIQNVGINDMFVEIFVNKTKNAAGDFAGIGSTDSDGYFNISCQVPEIVDVGTNQILAHAVRSSVYNESWSDPQIEIYSNTTLVLDMAQSVGIGDYLSITGYLVDASDQPISGEQIKIYFDGAYIGQAITTSSGQFVYNYYMSELGDHQVYVVFDGDTYLGSSSANQTVIVKDMKTSLQISVSPTTAHRGDHLSITGELNSGSNNPLPDSPIYIYYNSKQVLNTTTSSSGTLSETISVPSDSPVGQITLKANYPGTSTYAEANAEEQLTIKSDTQLTITSPSEKNIAINETIIINGTLKDDANYPVKDSVININWTFFDVTVKTNSSGYFNISYTIPSNASLGTSTITAEFSGTEYYLPSQDSIDVNIVQSNFAPPGTVGEESQNKYILLAIAAVAIAIIVGAIMLFRKERIQEVPSIEEIAAKTIHNLKTEGDYRQSVINCYKQMCNWLNRRGVSKASCQTPREFAMAAKNLIRVSPETLYNLTQIFEKARYSKHDIDVEDRDNAIRCLNEIISAPVNVPINAPVNNNVGVVNNR